MDDGTLLQRWRDGDVAAGNALFERHFAAVSRFVKNKVSQLRDVEDLVQRIFLACVEGRERFEGRSSFRTFVFAIARHKLLDHLRATSRDVGRFSPEETSVADLDPSPSLILVKQAEQAQLVHALRSIPVDFQIALELHYWEELSGREIAEVLDIPEGTVRFRLRRGRQLLGEALERETGVAVGELDELDARARALRDAVHRS